jgi:hypothetical protein
MEGLHFDFSRANGLKNMRNLSYMPLAYARGSISKKLWPLISTYRAAICRMLGCARPVCIQLSFAQIADRLSIAVNFGASSQGL